MSKKSILFLGFLAYCIAIKSQCSVSATPLSSTIACGQSVQLNAAGLGGNVTLNNDFNLGNAGLGWTTTSGANFTNPCGASPNGSTYLWMGSGSAAPRTVETVGLNINCGGSICFDLRFSVQGGASPCEGPDLATEGVYLQYSINGGGTWNTIFYFDPNINNSGGSSASPYTTWANYCYSIPAAAVSPNTIFRWAQLAVSANVNDHWGIDNVVISGTCANPYNYIWTPSNTLSANNITNPVASPLTTTTYTVYYTDGISDTCSASVVVNVIVPNVDAGLLQSVCLGQSVSLNGSSTTTMVNPVTFTESNPMGIFDYSTTTSNLNVSGLNLNFINTTSISQVCLDITHTWDSDLNISLICPSGTTLLLSGANGGAGDNYTQTCFTPTAINVIGSVGNNTAPFTGTFAPEGGSLTALNGCLANGNYKLVITDNFGGDQGTLNNWSITFNDQITPTLNWSPSSGMVGSTTYTPSFTPTTSGTYTLTLTTVPGCLATDTVSVLVNALPTPFAGLDATICSGQTTQLNAVGGLNYSWSPSTGLSSTTLSNPTASPSTSTNYVVTVSNGTCLGTDSLIVFVNQTPIVDAGANTTICSGTTTVLQATGASSYTWFPATGLNSTIIANPTSSANVSTTYYLVGTDVNNCIASDSVVITVNATPNAQAGADKVYCSGGFTTLNGSGGGIYSWSPGLGLNNTAIASPTANPTVTTTYIVTITNGSSCVDKDTVVVTVNALPVVDAGVNQVICAGSSVTLNGTGAVSYLWSPATSLSSATIFNPVATPTANTTYSMIGTGANGCSKTDAVSIIVLPGILVNASANQSICKGSSTPLTATSSATTFAWTPSSGLSSTNTANTIASPTVSTTYIVTATSGICSAKDTVIVTVNNLPVVSAGADISYCLGNSSQLNASGGLVYSWNPALGLSSSSISNPILTTSVNTSYTLTVTDGNGCVNKDTLNVVVNALPVADAGINQSICAGQTVILNGTGGVSYSWLPANSLSNATIFNPVASPITNTTYTLTVTSFNGCSKLDSVSIAMIPTVSVVASSNQSICIGASTPLSATSTATIFTWSPSIGLSATNTSNTIASPTVTTSYIVTAYNGACLNQDTVLVTVNNLPVVSAGSDIAYCVGDTSQLIGSGGGAYVWSPGLGLSSSVISNPTLTATSNSTYTLTATDLNGCINSDTINVVVSALPIVSAGNNSSICIGNNLQFNASGALNYSWLPAAGLNNSALSNPIATPNSTTTYTVIGSDVNGCSNSSTITISVNNLPNVTVNSTTLCLGVSDTLVANGATTYVWNPSGILIGGNSIVVSPLLTTNYFVFGTDANGCVDSATAVVTVAATLSGTLTSTALSCNNLCNGSATANITPVGTYNYVWSNGGFTGTISNLCVGNYTVVATSTAGCVYIDSVSVTSPLALSATLSATSISCTNSSATITSLVSGGTVGYTYAWQPAAIGANPSVTVSGTYTLTVTDANSCVVTQTVVVNSNTIVPSANAGLNSILDCGATASLNLNGSSTTNGVNYSWAGPSGFTSAVSNPTITNVGTYTLTITDPANGCSSTSTVAITQQSILASFTASPSSGNVPLNVVVTNASTNATSYNWIFGNGNTANTLNSSTVYSNTGTYTITLIVTNAFSCIDSTSVTIVVSETIKIIIPNIFSPNGDGVNDLFFIDGTGVKTLSVTIFNRWGNKLYEYNTINGSWSGDGHGDGTYFYLIVAVGNDDKEVRQEGYFDLVR